MFCGANKTGFHFKNYNVKRDTPKAEIVDIATVIDGDICPKCGAKMRLTRGIEVGNIFKLGTKYTEAMHMTYTDEDGTEKTPIAQRMALRVLTLPLYADLSLDDVDRICGIILSCKEG